MQLTAAEGRVLGCLITKNAADPQSLDEVRFACNQSDWRQPIAYDDRIVEDALLALKSKGLARFVGGRGMGPVRYRHRADERWRMSPSELAVLACLLLHGPQTVNDVRTTVDDSEVDVEAVLDALAGRTPSPFATRLAPTSRNPDVLWAEILTGRPTADELYEIHERREPGPAPSGKSARRPAPPSTSSGAGTVPPDRVRGRDPQLWRNEETPSATTLAELADRLARIERRLASIETTLQTLERSRTTGQVHESDRVIR